MSPKPFEPEYIFGMHDPGGEHLMRDAKRKGWILFTEATGHDPSHDGGSQSYAGLAAEGFGIIARLNNGYYPHGTIPHSSQYENFATRLGNWARNSPGCGIWIIGNEQNYIVERPGVEIDWGRSARGGLGEGESFARGLRDDFRVGAPTRRGGGWRILKEGEKITPQMYARCYSLCRDAIHSQPDHEDDLVLIGSVAPWNNNTGYEGNLGGDWVQYFRDILTTLGPDGCDGITIHTYTHGYDLDLITKEFLNDAPGYQHLQREFRTYIDFMKAIPENMRHLPLYLTETDQNETWEDKGGSTWVQEAYAEINRWNQEPGKQQIRAMILYRWPKVGDDRWWIVGKNGVIGDFKEAMKNEYRWNPTAKRKVDKKPLGSFGAGQQVFASAVVNIRRTPGFRAKSGDDVQGQVAYRTLVTIQGSPQGKDGLTWWRVRTTLPGGKSVEGWMAEATADGTPLLSAEMPPAQPADGPSGGFAAGQAVTIVNAEGVRIRRTPGYQNKPGDDVVGVARRSMAFTLDLGPQENDGLFWWQVSGTTPDGTAIAGWAAEASPDGTRLLAPADVAEGIHVGKPFEGDFAVTQWWGSRPDFYKQFTYDGVPLEGHNGIDFGLPVGTPVFAVDAGRVKLARSDPGGFGEFVLLEHAWGESIYAHQSALRVTPGQEVGAGEEIGLSGNTGNSSGPHLHFAVRITPYRRTDGWGGFANPAPFMDRAHLIASRAPEMPPTPMGEEALESPRP